MEMPRGFVALFSATQTWILQHYTKGWRGKFMQIFLPGYWHVIIHSMDIYIYLTKSRQDNHGIHPPKKRDFPYSKTSEINVASTTAQRSGIPKNGLLYAHI